jgi:hypothetical protein
MAKITTSSKLGHWVFLIGIALAVILGIMWPNKILIAGILVLLGIIVGFLNIRVDETHDFLLASVALLIAAKSFQFIPAIGPLSLENILTYLAVFVAAAAVIVSLTTVWKLASTR